jgi:hypothetical protein
MPQTLGKFGGVLISSCVPVFREMRKWLASSDAINTLFHWCNNIFIDSFSVIGMFPDGVRWCSDGEMYGSPGCVITFNLFSVLRRALPIGESWSRGCFTSSSPTSGFGMRWTIFVSSTDLTLLSLPRGVRPTPSWWQSISEGACGSVFTAPWVPLSRSAGELV